MKASKETARAARMQCGQLIELLANDAPHTVEHVRKLLRDVIAFCDSAGKVLPSDRPAEESELSYRGEVA